MLAVVYAICVLAPAAALALSDNPMLAHCLTEGHVGIHVHVDSSQAHVDATAHEHHHHDAAAAHEHRHDGASQQQQSRDQGSIADCCGLFSVVALAGDPGLALGPAGHASLLAPPRREALSGRGPERLYRPPIFLLSL